MWGWKRAGVASTSGTDLFRSEPLPDDAAPAPPPPPAVDTQTEVRLEVGPEGDACTHLERVRTVVPAAPGCHRCPPCRSRRWTEHWNPPPRWPVRR